MLEYCGPVTLTTLFDGAQCCENTWCQVRYDDGSRFHSAKIKEGKIVLCTLSFTSHQSWKYVVVWPCGLRPVALALANRRLYVLTSDRQEWEVWWCGAKQLLHCQGPHALYAFPSYDEVMEGYFHPSRTTRLRRWWRRNFH